MFAPLEIEFKASKHLSVYFIALLLLSYLAVMMMGLPLMIAVSIVLAVSLYGFILWRRYVSHFYQWQPSSACYQDRHWFLVVAGEKLAVELHESVVWSFIAVARYKNPLTAQKYTVIVLPDSCDKDSYRRLTVLWRSAKAFSSI